MFDNLIAQQRAAFRPFRYKGTKRDLITLAIRCRRDVLNTFMKVQDLSGVGELTKYDLPFLLDHLFKGDKLFMTDLADGREIGVLVDVTANPDDVFYKDQELRGMKACLRAIGVEIALVALWEIESFKREDLNKGYELASRIIDCIDALSVDTRGRWVGTVLME